MIMNVTNCTLALGEVKCHQVCNMKVMQSTIHTYTDDTMIPTCWMIETVRAKYHTP